MTQEEREKQIEDIMIWADKQPFDYDVCKTIAIKEIASLIEQKPDCYSAEFIVWIGFMSSRLVYYRERDDKWLFTKDLDKIDEWTEFTLDELYDYWKENIKEK